MPLTQSAQTLAQQIKNETAFHHQQTEAVLMPALQSIRSLSDYGAVLKMFYGFFHPLEQCILQYISSSELHDIDRRRNSQLIKEDLKVLGDSASITLCSSMPQVKNTAQAFGALYVLEGSTLGGRVIAKMLAKNGANIPPEAVHFFNGYGEATGKMWTIFLEALNKVSDAEAATGAANETFSNLKNWMQSVLNHETTN